MNRLDELMLLADVDSWSETDIRFALIVFGEMLEQVQQTSSPSLNRARTQYLLESS